MSVFIHQHSRGFGIIELIVAMSLSGILALGAYKLIGNSASASKGSFENATTLITMGDLLQRMSTQFQNIPPIVGGDSGHSLVSTCGSSTFSPTSLQPLPGKVADELKNYTLAQYQAVNPTTVTLTDSDNDAVRYLTLDEDSASYPLATSAATLGGFNVPEPTQGTTSIVIKGLTRFRVGDFALLTDEISSVLFRITGISVAGSGANAITSLEHGSASAWNQNPIQRNYGLNSDGTAVLTNKAYVHRVKIFTIALGPDDQSSTHLSLMRYDSLYDDQFDPVSGNFGSGSGPVEHWNVVARDMEQLRVFYVFGNYQKSDMQDPVKALAMRKPIVGSANSTEPTCKVSDTGSYDASKKIGLRHVVLQLNSKDKKWEKTLVPYERSGETGLTSDDPCTGSNASRCGKDQGGQLQFPKNSCPEGYVTVFSNQPDTLESGGTGNIYASCDSYNPATCVATCSYKQMPQGLNLVSNGQVWISSPNFGGGGN